MMTKTEPRYETVAIDSIQCHPENANNGDVEAIAESLRVTGQYTPLTVQESTRYIIKGNHTWMAAKELGWTEIEVRFEDRTDDVAKRIMVADNKIASLAKPDEGLLVKLLESLPSIEGTGYDQRSLDELLARVNPPQGLTDPDDVPASPKEPVTKLGDLWLLGDHRLLCGDATQKADMGRLVAAKPCQMMFTDPPYGVDYRGGHFHSGDVNIKRERESLAGDGNADLYGAFLPIALEIVDGPCYLWFAGSKALAVYQALANNKAELSALLIWHKTNAKYAAMNAQYKQRHEPCLYFKPKGSTLRWAGPTDERTVWELPRDPSNDLHPTQKPVALAQRAIKNHDAETVLDCFAGSGSTLIAAHQEGRVACLMEIDPGYCDVICRRFQEFTGIVPIRDGQEVSFVS